MWTFRAMNTDVTVSAPTLDDERERAFATTVMAIFDEVEARFSRFLPSSELAHLNAAAGAIAITKEMLELLRACRTHVVETAGVFDPTIGRALAAAGYDRSFAPGALDRCNVSFFAAEPPRSRFSDVHIDESARVVRRPPHVQLDFGGFLKGRTVDRAAQKASFPIMIDAGGDMALRGDGPDGDGWLVDIEDPLSPDTTLATLRVRDRAVATSAANRRRWRIGGALAHHIIDPRTGLPSTSDLAQVTVVAPTAERADVMAKTAFILGRRDGARFIAGQPDLGAVLVGRDRSLQFIGHLEVVP